MTNRKFWQYLVMAIAVTLLIPTVAQAHTGVGDTNGFWHGLEHPLAQPLGTRIGGLDHILAMVAVGLWAAQIGGKAIWIVPSAFVVSMTASSVLGHLGVPFPGIEQGILASDFILGLLILFAARFPLAISTTIVAILAIFHGYAHGAEMPSNASGLTYAIGFIVATTGLHLAGIGTGLAIVQGTGYANDRYQPTFQDRLFRCGGAVVLVGAVYVLANH
jgi:urease accessory protein